ncbi:MAG: hypothetical protein OCD02_17495 [Spirochaetaceae bacterium]
MNIFKETTELQEKNVPFAITTITEKKGSSPRSTAKMIVLQNGNIIGTIGGGYVNLAVSKAAALFDFDIQIVENRKDFVSKERFPMARKCYYDNDLVKAINQAEIEKDTYIVIATNHDDSTSIREVIFDGKYDGVLEAIFYLRNQSTKHRGKI